MNANAEERLSYLRVFAFIRGRIFAGAVRYANQPGPRAK
jgi:hypothetical protein